MNSITGWKTGQWRGVLTAAILLATAATTTAQEPPPDQAAAALRQAQASQDLANAIYWRTWSGRGR